MVEPANVKIEFFLELGHTRESFLPQKGTAVGLVDSNSVRI